MAIASVGSGSSCQPSAARESEVTDSGSTWARPTRPRRSPATADAAPPRAEIVNLGGRAAQIPSVLHLSPDGTVLVGEAAERRVVTEPDRVVREFKRQVGDPTPIVIDGVDHAAHDLMALLVGHVVDQVGAAPGRTAGTHRAHPPRRAGARTSWT